MKKVSFIFLFLTFISCSNENNSIDNQTIEKLETNESISTTTMSTSSTTSSIPTYGGDTIEEYLGDSFNPYYSPNYLFFWEEDTKYDYYFQTRNPLVVDKVFDQGLSLEIKYRDSFVWGDDIECENHERVLEFSADQKKSPAEICNGMLKRKSINYIRYPEFRNSTPDQYIDTPLDNLYLGKCTEDLNQAIFNKLKPISDYFLEETQRQFDEDYIIWFTSTQSIDYQIHHISPREINDVGNIAYTDAIFIWGEDRWPGFYISEITDHPDEFGYISILFYIYRYYGGAANGHYSYISFNYDLVNCNEINLEDIFSDKNLNKTLEVDSLFDEGLVELPPSYDEAVLAAWIKSEIPAWVHAATHEVAKVLCLLDYELCDMYKLEDDFLLSPNVSPSIDWLSRFVLDEHGITFAFNEHQNSCGACFSPNPRVSYDRFYRILDFSKLNSRK